MAATEEMLSRLDHAMNRLPESDRQILFLRYFEGLDSNGIATRLGLTPEAAQKRCERSKARLARHLSTSAIALSAVIGTQLTGQAAGRPSITGNLPMPQPLAHDFVPWLARWRWPIGISLGIGAAVLLIIASATHDAHSNANSQPTPSRVNDEGTTLRSATSGTASSSAQDLKNIVLPSQPTPSLDLITLSAHLELADEGSSTDAAIATQLMAAISAESLLLAADQVPALTLAPNRLRVLALGIASHLVTRDGRIAVLASEKFRRASHAPSTPALAEIAQQGLERWAAADYAAAKEWWLANDSLFEDRGEAPACIAGSDPDNFHAALAAARNANTLPERLLLADAILKTNSAAMWSAMCDVWAHKLPPAEARTLADALWQHPGMNDDRILALRLAIVTVPSAAPSVEALRWAATRPGSPPDPDVSAQVIAAWQQRAPDDTARWLAAAASELRTLIP